MENTVRDEKNETRPNVSEMTDRQLLEEIAVNMRIAADMVIQMSQAVKTNGIMGLLRGG